MAGLEFAPALAPAVAAIERGDLRAAEQWLVGHIADHGDAADPLLLLATVRRLLDPRKSTVDLLDRALASDPAHLEARLAHIDAAVGERRYDEALDHLHALPVDKRAEFGLASLEADVLGRLGHHAQELLLYDRLIAMQPATVSLRASKANALRILGRSEEAAAVLVEALRLQPDYGQAWWLLSDLKDFRFDEQQLATMRGLLDGPASDADRIALHFALGKALEDDGDLAAAFASYAAGNALRSASFGRERIGIAGKVNRTIAVVTHDFLAQRSGQGHPSGAPIFVVGLQRSGSTLIEQILASHPLIEGTSELPVIDRIMQEIATDDRLAPATGMERLAKLGRHELRQYGQLYLDGAAAYRRTDRPRFVDKMPGNWAHLALIRLILPHAKIIDARRHPLATGLSNFRQNYGSGGFFAYGQATFAAYYRQYLRMMTHFEQVDPGSIHRAVNERLIADLETEVRALLAFIGVEHHPACLEFHRNTRAVATPSAAQVRRPINRDGIDRWRAFEPWLDEMKQALGPGLDGWDLPPGAYRDEED